MLILWSISAGTFFIPKPQKGFSAVFFAAGSNEIAHLAFSRDNHWLINSGRTFPGDQAKWIVEPYLRSLGIKKLKGILFADMKRRHTAGFDSLKRNFYFQYQVYPAKEKSEPLSSRDKVYLKAGDSIHMPEGGRIHVVGHSLEAMTFQIVIDDKTILFLPDISFPVFQQLYRAKNIHADILVLPSLRDPDTKLLKSILTVSRAKTVIMPKLSAPLLEIFEEKGISIFDLSKRGALQLELDKSTGEGLLKWIPFKTA